VSFWQPTDLFFLKIILHALWMMLWREARAKEVRPVRSSCRTMDGRVVYGLAWGWQRWNRESTDFGNGLDVTHEEGNQGWLLGLWHERVDVRHDR
jgi:hypothetical protein